MPFYRNLKRPDKCGEYGRRSSSGPWRSETNYRPNLAIFRLPSLLTLLNPMRLRTQLMVRAGQAVFIPNWQAVTKLDKVLTLSDTAPELTIHFNIDNVTDVIDSLKSWEGALMENG